MEQSPLDNQNANNSNSEGPDAPVDNAKEVDEEKRPDKKQKKEDKKKHFYTPLAPETNFKESAPLYKSIIYKLTQSGIIILGGDNSTRNEKNQFARSLAHRLKKVFDNNLEICEWKKNTEEVYDIPIFLTEEKRGIFILTDLSPRIVQYDLNSIQDVVHRKSHMLIITTTASRKFWSSRLPQSMDFFEELVTEDLFDLNDLELKLIDLFYDSRFWLTGEIWKEFIDSYEVQKENNLDLRELRLFPLSPNRTITHIARCLKGYENLEAFVRLISGKHKPKERKLYDNDNPTESSEHTIEIGGVLKPSNEVEVSNIYEYIGEFEASHREPSDAKASDPSEHEKEDAVYTDEMIDEMIEKVKSNDWGFAKWFSQLDKQHKHLLVGVTLLSGLYESQLFSALEDLVENEWRAREPFMADFDYAELEFLRDYAVVFIVTGENESIIEIKPGLRRQAFKECWYYEKRFIVNSIRGLINLVKNSINQQNSSAYQDIFDIPQDTIDKLIQLDIPPYIIEKIETLRGKIYPTWSVLINEIEELIGNKSFKLFRDKLSVVFDFDRLITDDEDFREIALTAKKSQLYGTDDKTSLLRQAIGTAIRQIANESLAHAEEALFYFASTRSKDMHTLAAMSLAQWKEHKNDPEENQKFDDQLYEILNRWHKKPEKVFDPFGAGLPSEKRVFIEDNREAVLATIVLTIGFAASYDDSNQCSEQLLNLLKAFLPPGSEQIIAYLNEVTVRLLIKHHPEQLHLDGLLYDLMKYRELIESIAKELSFVYIKIPHLFNEIINRIDENCDKYKLAYEENEKKEKKLRKKGKEISALLRHKADEPKNLRKHFMLTLISIFGFLRFTEGEGRLTPQETFERLESIYENEDDEPDLQKAVADAVCKQVKRDFDNIENEIKSILAIFNLMDGLQVIPGFVHHNRDQRKKLEDDRAKKKEKFIANASFDDEFDETLYDPKGSLTKMESKLFNWIHEGGFKLRKISFITLFCLTQPNFLEEKQFESLKSDINKKIPFKIFKVLLIPVLCSINLKRIIIVGQLLPAAISLKHSFYQDMMNMLDIWRNKLGNEEYKGIKKLGHALSRAISLADNFIIVIAIYISIAITIWALSTRYF